MVGDTSSRKGDHIFKKGEYRPFPIAVEQVVEAGGQAEGKKKKRKKNSEWHKVGHDRLRAHINVVIRHTWMMWFILTMEEKRDYLEYYIPGTNMGVS
ncbi:hypothetical protein R1flu_023831 [Riccia fluitans]|uniref:Uncharacterized protein n=1 Tax=Riccia fluitans TaxID=41844 RepID=A0ABD1XT55_9MARC